MGGKNIVRDLGYKPVVSKTSIGNYMLYLHPDAPCRAFSNLEEVISRISILKRHIIKGKPAYVNMPNEDIKRLEEARLKIVGNERKVISSKQYAH